MATLAPGSQFGEYDIERVLSKGGMGVVYKATRTRTGQAIALKVIAPERAADPSYRERFVREANVLVGLQHPRIVPLVDWGDVEGTLYLALAYLDGPNLEDLIERDGPFSLSRTIEYLAPVAEALDAAHRRGYIHRDVKPANIMLDGDGNVYLTDFGLGKLAASTGMTQTNTAVGTLAYMSPEQFTGKLADPSLAGRTDTYALGCVLHACLTRQEIVPTDSFARAMHAVVEEPPPRLSEIRPSLPADLDDVQARVLAKDPADRYETAAAYIAAVRAVLIANPEPAAAAPVQVPGRPEQRQRIEEVAAIGAAVVPIPGATELRPVAGPPPPPGARTVLAEPPLPQTILAKPAPKPPSLSPVNRLGLAMVVAGIAGIAVIGGIFAVSKGDADDPTTPPAPTATLAAGNLPTPKPTPRPTPRATPAPTPTPSASPTEPPASEPPPTEPPPTAAPWATRTSSRFHYSMKVPADWNVTRGNVKKRLADWFDNDGFPYVSVYRDGTPGTASLSGTVDNAIAALKRSDKAKLVSNKPIRLPGGHVGRILSFTGTDRTSKTKEFIQKIVVVRRNVAYFIGLYADYRTRAADAKLFRQIYKTWRPR